MSILVKPTYSPPIVDTFTNGQTYRGGELHDWIYVNKDPAVVCVWWGTKYGIEYVRRLKAAVDANLRGILDVPFYCLTNHRDQADYAELESYGIIAVPTVHTWDGWWQKIGLFNRDLWGASDRILYLDLDVVITGPLDDLFTGEHHLNMIANFGVNFQHSKYNSSVMSWDAHGPAGDIYDCFVAAEPDKVMKALHGDQCFIWRAMLDDVRVWPEKWAVSYKYDVRRAQGALHDDTRAVIFHGDPKPDVVKDAFVIQNWRNA